MNDPADTILEQLSAFMDGELPDSEARFLLRRLESDPALRQRWDRMQMAAACLKGQPLRAMHASLASDVQRELAGERSDSRNRPLLRWGVAASVIALAVLLGPRMMSTGDTSGAVPQHTVASASGSPRNAVASPGSADLVGALAQVPTAATSPAVAAASSSTSSARVSELIAGAAESAPQESPMPLSSQSPADFPLVDGGDKRSWPRSGLASATNDPALEAYLVRHNQLLANDGIGGFVPYLDVVAPGQPGSAAAAGSDSPGDPAAGESRR